MSDYLPIKPWAERSDSFYCQCDCCHDITRVVKLHYQKTGYWEKVGTSFPLSQKECELWMCDDCLKKIVDALINI